jgi:hypothetical protein
VPRSPNGDAHADADVGPNCHRADGDADADDAVSQEDGEVTEQPPPTPAKDESVAGGRTHALVPVAVGTSEA